MMPSVAELLERESTTVDLEGDHLERLLHRRDRKRRNERIRAGALAVIVAVVTAVALTRAFNMKDRTADETPSPALKRNGEVLTVLGDIQAQDPATGEVRTLVDLDSDSGLLGYRIDSAAWSADDRWAAFEIRGCDDETGGASGLWVTNGVDEPLQLTTKLCPDDPDRGLGALAHEHWEWSPVGAQLVVARQAVEGDLLLLIDPATGDRTNLGEAAGEVTSIAWSPDGTRIAYGAVPAGSQDEYSSGSLFSVDVGGGEHSLLASSVGLVSGGETGSGIRWSLDGTHIAVTTETEIGPNRLYLMNADGSDLDLLTEGVVIAHTLGAPNLVWSPDGTGMAYATSEGRDHVQVWNASTDGSPPIPVFESTASARNVFAGGPVWSPDGTRIAFRYDSRGEKSWLVVDADGTGDASEIDELRYRSWRGGWYFCECYG
jgi:dipeptidyl aminopeptidase/acylaminoacyl peptidase